jgi:hypothetical protein
MNELKIFDNPRSGCREFIVNDELSFSIARESLLMLKQHRWGMYSDETRSQIPYSREQYAELIKAKIFG